MQNFFKLYISSSGVYPRNAKVIQQIDQHNQQTKKEKQLTKFSISL